MGFLLCVQAGKAALVAEESAVSAANLARAARTQAALGAAMLAAQAYNQVCYPCTCSCSLCGCHARGQQRPQLHQALRSLRNCEPVTKQFTRA